MKSAGPRPGEGPAPLRGDVQAGALRGKTPPSSTGAWGVAQRGTGAWSDRAAGGSGPGVGPAGRGAGEGSGRFSQGSTIGYLFWKEQTPETPPQPQNHVGNAPFSIPLRVRRACTLRAGSALALRMRRAAGRCPGNVRSVLFHLRPCLRHGGWSLSALVAAGRRDSGRFLGPGARGPTHPG